MKKIVTLSTLSLGILFLAGCGQQQTSQTQPIAPAPVVKQPATNQPVTIQPTPIETQPPIITSIDPTCMQWYDQKDKYCKQFSIKTCASKSFQLENKQQFNCKWNDSQSVCKAQAFCE
jgi:PBP1b-binding outer membrane lipoprotein LpoB